MPRVYVKDRRHSSETAMQINRTILYRVQSTSVNRMPFTLLKGKKPSMYVLDAAMFCGLLTSANSVPLLGE